MTTQNRVWAKHAATSSSLRMMAMLLLCLVAHLEAFQFHLRASVVASVPRSGATVVNASENLIEVPPTPELAIPSGPHLIFPGGGIFFYWQAGAVTYLREQGYDLSQVTASGASAGALTATLMATGVCFEEATKLALRQAEEAGVWDRSGGLQGIWGDLIYQWLDELIPEKAVEKVQDGQLSLLITKLLPFGKSKVATFQNKQDLIKCNMASVHLPWFLDGQWTSNFRGHHHIDGSFLSNAQQYLPDTHKPKSIIRLDWTKDPALADTKMLDFVQAVSPESIWAMLEQGKAYAKLMEQQGKFKSIPKLR